MTANSSSQKSMTARRFSALLMVLAPFAGLVLLMNASGANQVTSAQIKASLPKVEVIQVALQDSYQQRRLAVGRIEPAQQAQLGFELAGTLASIQVDEGMHIKAGQLLATLDTQRLQARQQELAAALARAESQLRLAVLSQNRIKDLVAANLESPQRLDEVAESTTSARAQVTEIKARQLAINVELNKSRLLAPFDAVVVSRPLDPGTVVAAGQSIVSLHSDQDLEARISLAADDAFELQQGNAYSLLHGQTELAATLLSKSRTRRLDTRTVDVLFRFDNAGNSVLPGDLITFEFSKAIPQQGCWVPNLALSNGTRGLWNIFVVTGQAEQKIQSRAVSVLYTDGEKAFVTGALAENDLLVVSGTHKLVPEQQVRAVLLDNAMYAGR